MVSTNLGHLAIILSAFKNFDYVYLSFHYKYTSFNKYKTQCMQFYFYIYIVRMQQTQSDV